MRFFTSASIFLVCVGQAAAADDLLKSSMRSYRLGGEMVGYYFAAPSGQFAADFDGDGDIDMAYGNAAMWSAETPVLGIVTNRGDGTFTDPAFFTGSVGPTSAVAGADLDGDGDIDLALTQQSTISGTRVLIYLNNGAGVFSESGTFPTGRAPRDITAADFDGDGDTDLATTASTNQTGQGRTVSVLFNDGAAGFASRVDLPTADIPYWIASGDLNGDGAADIACTYWGWNDFSVFLSDGSGGFHPMVRYSAPGLQQTPDRVAIGDVTGDGVPDVVYGEYQEFGFPGAVGVFRNLGDGSLAPGYPVATVLERDPLDIDIVDVNGDGLADIAFTAGDIVGDGWGFLAGRGDGTFDTAEYFTVGDVAEEVAIADVTGDGRADALVTVSHLLHRGSGSLNVHAQDAGGGFGLPPLTEVDGQMYRLDVDDADGDGDPDVVLAYSTSFITLLNNGDGTFTTRRESRQLGCMRAIRLADIDGDGAPDLILTKHPNCPPYNLYTAINDGDGTFGQVRTHALSSAGDNEQVALDYDNDGDMDIAVSESLATPNEGSALVYLVDNNGDGTFAPARRVHGANNESVRRVEAADMDGDGNVDIVGSGAGDGVTILFGDGAGNFPTLVRFVPAPQADRSSVSWVIPADFNGDGNMDVGWAGVAYMPWDFGDTAVPAAGVMLGDGNGGLTDAGIRFGPDGSEIEMFGADAADIDGDGVLDLVSSGQTMAEVIVFRGVGDGSLLEGKRYGVDTGTYQPHAGDFDGDGVEDVVVVGSRMEGGYVSMLFSTGETGCAADFNGDGVVNTQDVLAFLNAWTSADSDADFNGDGVINTQDVLAFLNAWNVGC